MHDQGGETNIFPYGMLWLLLCVISFTCRLSLIENLRLQVNFILVPERVSHMQRVHQRLHLFREKVFPQQLRSSSNQNITTKNTPCKRLFVVFVLITYSVYISVEILMF